MIGPGQDRYKLVPTAYDRVLVQQNQGDSKVDAQLHGCAPSCQWLILFVGFNPAHYKMTYGSAESPSEKSDWACDAAHEDHDGSGVEEGSGRGERGLRIFPQTAVAADPREEPFDHPPPRVDGKADLVRRLAHDLDGDDRRRGRFVAGVTL